MPAICPACSSFIAADDINVAADTAFCRACGHSTAFSAIIHAPTAGLYSAPPDHCDVQEDGVRWRAVASTRSWRFFPTVLFALLWNGFLVILVAGFFTTHAPLFVLAFLSGHLGAGAFMAWTAARMAVGDVDITIENDEVIVGSGIGPLRWRHRRPFRDIRSVRQEPKPRSMFGATTVIVLEGPRPLKFGALLNDERRQFLHAAFASRLKTRPAASA